MKILYLTDSFNCNSSSTHGFAFSKNKYKDKYIKYKFGWDNFILSSEKSKTFYMIVMLLENIYEKYPLEIVQYIIKNWLGIKLNKEYMKVIEVYKNKDNFRLSKNAYIDHQSLYFMPYMHHYTSKGCILPSKEFIQDFYKFIMQENLVVFGGNDNSESEQPPDNEHVFELGIPTEIPHRNLICRKDIQYDYWTLFSMDSGFKLRFKFQEDSIHPNKSSYPELVDIKITEKCNSDCPWCYQNSNHHGKHSDWYYLSLIAEKLGELECFEVALGGGEPTIHPDFPSILENFRKNGIVPNFTTRRFDWVNNYGWAGNIFNLAGKIAFSVFNKEDIGKMEILSARLNEYAIPNRKVTMQIPMGVVSEDTLVELLESCKKLNFSVNLLGYKNYGRGKNFSYIPYDKSKIYIIVKSFSSEGLDISIDTCLANDWKDFIKRDNRKSFCYKIQLEEGKFSCYIDAVNKRIGPSSYSDKLEMLCNLDDIPELYKKY